MWVREKCFDIAPNLPISQTEHYFRDLDDSEELLSALEDDRFIWDGACYESHEYLPEFKSKHIYAIRTVMAK